MGCLIFILIFAVVGVIAIPLMALLQVSKASAKSKARRIVSGEVTATPREINNLIDRIRNVQSQSLSEEDRDLIDKLRKVKAEME